MKYNKMLNKIKWAGEQILSLLYPDICPFCGRILKRGRKEQICPVCQFKLPYIYEPRCKKCGKPVSKDQQEYCWDCEHHRHYYERGLAVWEHQPIVARSLYQFKYHNRRIYSRFFAKEMVRSYKSIIHNWNIDLIVPIPISKKRKRQRGYNQAELIARDLGILMGIPVESCGLVRIKDTVAQKKLDVQERKRNLFRAFAWRREKKLRGNVLLIDDIYTTGNTIDAAAKILKEAGAIKVYFLTVSIGEGY